jgi:hypothetical protein
MLTYITLETTQYISKSNGTKYLLIIMMIKTKFIQYSEKICVMTQNIESIAFRTFI